MKKIAIISALLLNVFAGAAYAQEIDNKSEFRWKFIDLFGAQVKGGYCMPFLTAPTNGRSSRRPEDDWSLKPYIHQPVLDIMVTLQIAQRINIGLGYANYGCFASQNDLSWQLKRGYYTDGRTATTYNYGYQQIGYGRFTVSAFKFTDKKTVSPYFYVQAGFGDKGVDTTLGIMLQVKLWDRLGLVLDVQESNFITKASRREQIRCYDPEHPEYANFLSYDTICQSTGLFSVSLGLAWNL